MRDRRRSIWAVEHLSKEHVADHIAQGSSGWWKWITNKHKSGKLQASAPELLQLRKTIRQKQLHGRKTVWQEVTSLLRQNYDAPLHSTELIYSSTVLIFSLPPSAKIKVISLTALFQRNDTSVSSLWEMLREGPGRLAQWVWQGWLHTADTPEDGKPWIIHEPKTTPKNIVLILNGKTF